MSDNIKLRNKKARKIQFLYSYPRVFFNTYEELVCFIDRELESEASSIYWGNPSQEFIKIIDLVDELCKSIYIGKNYLEKLRESKIITKGSLLDRMLEEIS